MQLSIADHTDVIKIIRQVYDIWSAGLKRADYRRLFWSSYNQSWSKRNICRMVHRIENEVVFSCKTVRLSLFKKKRYYQILGLGAIFTDASWRKQGLAGSLIKSVINQAEEENLDGILLFSAIDKNFYSSFGFTSLGSLDFEICPQNYFSKDNFVENTVISKGKVSIEVRNAEVLFQIDRLEKTDGKNSKFHFSSFEPWFSENELMEILRCHNRWLARQPYGIMRNRHYFSFQLARFLYFATYSISNKSAWFLTMVKDEQKGIIGYTFTECSGTNMRILELIGDDRARVYLWQSLIEQAKHMNLITIRGFESIVKDFIPNCILDHSLFSLEPVIKAKDIECYERLWSQPMFLALNPELTDLFDSHPCPLLEFDYI